MENETIQEENRNLRRAVEEMSFLNELSGAIGASFNSLEIMQTIIRKSIRAVQAEQGAIILVAEDESTDMKTLVRSMITVGDHRPFSLCQSLLGWMHINKKPLSVNDTLNDERFSGVEWDEGMKTVACAPLIVKSQLTGILSVYNKKSEGIFSDDDLRLLSIIAAQSAQIVENARLYEEEQDLMRMKEEARMASEIQVNLLPKSNPSIDGYDIAGKSIPASSVGGDYYDFITLDEKSHTVCLGDISGKGMPAALLMSNLQATIRGQVLAGGQPKECIARSNNLLYHSTEANKFATFFFAVLSSEENLLTYTNAGHDPPLFFQKSETPILLKMGGPVLGFLDNMEYKEETLALQPGDMITVYSDGITEAMDSEENEFSVARLQAVLFENRNRPSAEIIETVIDNVYKHSRDVPQSDDITIVVIKRI